MNKKTTWKDIRALFELLATGGDEAVTVWNCMADSERRSLESVAEFLIVIGEGRSHDTTKDLEAKNAQVIES